MPKKKPTSLTLAIYFSDKKPKQVAEYKAIHKEASELDLSPTDYLGRLVRLGREEAKKDQQRLFVKVA
jgi:hypothetical protein